MTRRIIAGNPPVEITLRRSAQARRYSLRVSQLDGRVTLSMPKHAREAEAMAFAQAKADWIRRALARQVPMRPVRPGSVLPFEGREVVVTPAPVRAVRIEGDLLLVPQGPAGRRIEAYLKLAARRRLQARCEHHAAALGRRFKRLTLRDTRSRWGSCSSAGGLMFSWRLIMAPPEVLDYVAAHEVAHLAEMNHAPAFWAVVARLMPGYERHRRWLRSQGAALHAIDFAGTGLGSTVVPNTDAD